MRQTFVCLRRIKWPLTPSASPAQCRLSLRHSSDSGQSKDFWGRETGDNYLVEDRTVLNIVENFPLELFAFPLLSPSSTSVLLSLNNRRHFVTFPTFFTSPPYRSTVCLRISAGRIFLMFQNIITDSTLHVAAFSISVFAYNDYREWGRGKRHRTTQYTYSAWHTLDY